MAPYLVLLESITVPYTMYFLIPLHMLYVFLFVYNNMYVHLIPWMDTHTQLLIAAIYMGMNSGTHLCNLSSSENQHMWELKGGLSSMA